MTLQTVFLIIFLALLFIICKKIYSAFYSLFLLLSRNSKFSLLLVSAILLPGTIVHEISHFLAATLLRVPTGEMSILPKIKMSGTTFAKATAVEEVQAGRLEIARTDPFRHALIGLAPMLVGLILIYVIGRIFFINLPNILDTKYLILNTIGGYLLFAVSSTMFSSKKDLETMVIALPITLLVIFMLNYIGVRIFFDPTLLEKTVKILTGLNGYLLICAVVNFVIWIALQCNLYLWQKILKKEIIVAEKT